MLIFKTFEFASQSVRWWITGTFGRILHSKVGVGISWHLTIRFDSDSEVFDSKPIIDSKPILDSKPIIDYQF